MQFPVQGPVQNGWEEGIRNMSACGSGFSFRLNPDRVNHKGINKVRTMMIKFGNTDVTGIAMFRPRRSKNITRRTIPIARGATEGSIEGDGRFQRTRYGWNDTGICQCHPPQKTKGGDRQTETGPQHGVGIIE